MCNPDGSRYCVWAYIYAALTFTGTPLYAFLDVLKKQNKNNTKKKSFTRCSLSLSRFSLHQQVAFQYIDPPGEVMPRTDLPTSTS